MNGGNTTNSRTEFFIYAARSNVNPTCFWHRAIIIRPSKSHKYSFFIFNPYTSSLTILSNFLNYAIVFQINLFVLS